MLLRLIHILVPIFGVIGIGYLFGRRFAPDVRVVNALNITIFTPALIFHALTEQTGHTLAIGQAAVAAVVMVVGAGMLGSLWARLTHRDIAVYAPPIMFPNCGNLGLPVAHLAFGSAGLALMVVLMVAENTLQFTLGLWVLGARPTPRMLARNPMLLATAAGLICMAVGWHAPDLVEPGIAMLANVSIPLMLISLGIRLASARAGQWRAGLAGGLAAPLAGLIVALPLVGLLHPTPPLGALIILFGVMPPAVLNYMLAEMYDVDPQRVAAIVAVGHTVALVTVPLTLAFVLS